MQEETACLAMLAACQHLWGLEINIVAFETLDAEGELVQALHESSPSLQAIDICRGSGDELIARRWEWPSLDGPLVWYFRLPQWESFW
jgi:hypothetical protein